MGVVCRPYNSRFTPRNDREMLMSETVIAIPARRGKAAFVEAGQTVRVINTHGEQVVDTWAFNRHDMAEFMSMEHSRATMHRLIPRVGDALLTNHRRPILTVPEDTSGGIHDTLMAACDRYRYEELGCTEYHDNCTDNLAQALAELGLAPPETPSPLNLFMNIPWTVEGALSFEPPVSTPGCYIRLRAEMGLVIAFSACPQDILPINGRAGRPTEAHFRIEGWRWVSLRSTHPTATARCLVPCAS
jgi:uncharacterized protein YcgI (DUF1989 family)